MVRTATRWPRRALLGASEPCWAQPDVQLPEWYVHLAHRSDAHRIAHTGELWPPPGVDNAVFAVAVGGVITPPARSAPGRAPAPGPHPVAVLFTTSAAPDRVLPHEVVWNREQPLAVRTVALLEAPAAMALLDGSAGIPDEGWWHTRSCVCPPCRCWAATNGW